MKAWLLKDFGLKNLHLAEVDTPTPKPGELLVKVGAVSLNFRDKAIVDGIYEPHLVPKPLIPVSDAAGEVVAVGDGVTASKSVTASTPICIRTGLMVLRARMSRPTAWACRCRAVWPNT